MSLLRPVRVPDETHDRLVVLKKATDKTLAALVKEAVDAYIDGNPAIRARYEAQKKVSA